MSAWTDGELDELRTENSQGYAEHGINHFCLFDDVTDVTIPEGHDCGGCSCHLSAPCHHCVTHLDPDESRHIGLMTGLLGRWTR